jgi:hypothetical protein
MLCGAEALVNMYEAVAGAEGAARAVPLILRGYLDHFARVPGAIGLQGHTQLPKKCVGLMSPKFALPAVEADVLVPAASIEQYL